MDAINTLRAVLAGGAAVAAVVAALHGLWATVAILVVGLVAHGWLWVQLARGGRPAGAMRPVPPAEARGPLH